MARLRGEPQRVETVFNAAGVSLSDLRHRCGWTQPDLARRARVCVRTIWALENGGAARIDTRRKLLKALAVPFEQHRAIFGELPGKPR